MRNQQYLPPLGGAALVESVFTRDPWRILSSLRWEAEGGVAPDWVTARSGAVYNHRTGKLVRWRTVMDPDGEPVGVHIQVWRLP